MAKKDYYDILGLSKNASSEDIKQAYKRLAKEFHPDVAKDKAQAEAKFKEINEAYQVLSDSEKKKMYDTYGTAQPGAGFGGQGPFGGSQSGQWGPFTYTYTSQGSKGGSPFGAGGLGEDFDPMDIFEQVFGFRDFGGGRRQRKGKTLQYEMVITFADSVRGREEEVSISGKKIKVKIPSGIRDGNQLRFEGLGEPGPDANTPPGDLILHLRVQPHKIFQRHGDDCYLVKEVNFVDAALGGEVEIPVVEPSSSTGESTTKLKIPSGTQPDTEFRIKGKGMPHLRASGRGDLYVRALIKIPQKLSREQKKLLEEYKRIF
ncbi:MAG: J domain-containing protein [Patescibacteria group bacterium]